MKRKAHLIVPQRAPWSRRSAGRRRGSSSPAAVLLSWAALLSACGALPDVAPFTRSTVMLASSTRSVGDATVAEVRLASQTVLPRNQASLEDEAERLAEGWAGHAAALDAAHEYARSLQTVVEASRSGAESVDGVVNAAEGLAQAVGLHFGAAVSIAGDALRVAYDQIARARGRRTLRSAVDDLTPAVSEVQRVLDASLEDLDEIVVRASQLQINALRSEHSSGFVFRDDLLGERARLYDKGWAALDDAEKTRLGEIEDAIAATNAWHAPFEGQRREILERRAALRQSIAATRRALAEWAAAHAEIGAALDRGGAVDTAALAAAIVEIRRLVDLAREL